MDKGRSLNKRFGASGDEVEYFLFIR